MCPEIFSPSTLLNKGADSDFPVRFNDIAWTNGDDDRSEGIIAGALDNGSLDLWDADNLLSGDG